MNLLKLAFKNTLYYKLSTLLTVLLLALGVATVSLIYYASKQLEQQLKDNLKSADIVVGAKGSPLQIVLSSLYQIDAPTGNINYSEVDKYANHPMVAMAIPLSFGDSYKGFRVVGTNEQYWKWKNIELVSGAFFQKPFEVVIGAFAAKQLNLKLGDTFHSNHGLEHGEAHEHHDFKVVGILKEGFGATDKLILCSQESIWQLHHSEKKDITAMILQTRSPMALFSLPKQINSQSTLQAALPSIEINRLLSLMDVGFKTLQLIAWCIIVISALSIFISMINALKDRKTELALMRIMGASRLKMIMMLLLEAFFVVTIGYVLGMIGGRLLLMTFSWFLESSFQTELIANNFSMFDLKLFIAVLILALVAAIIPAIMALRINIPKTLIKS